MTTNRQITANRKNARRSTGPKSSRGKSVSRLNAVKHGLRATIDVLPHENENDFCALQDCLIEEFEPVGALETQLVRQITVNLWRMERLFTLETGLLLNNMIETKREQLSAVEKKQYDLDLDALFPVNRTDEEEESFRKLMESINAERMELDQV